MNNRQSIPTESSRPHHSPNRIPEFIEDAIIAKRLGPYPRCGAVIQKELENEGVKTSVSSVNRVLDRAGLLKKKSKWKRYWRNTPRPLPDNPGDLVELDTIHFRPFWYRNNKTTWYVYTGLDVNTRTGFAYATERISPGPSLNFTRQIKLTASFNISCFQTDNGQEFGRYFTLNLGTRHRKIRKRKPNDNAHVEKFNRTLQEECINKAKFSTIKELNQCLKEYLIHYNNRRLHMGINFLAPVQKLNQIRALQTT
ncbi:MAG: integrase core domain-containing protein [Candidatus Berkelbacteria bacterium]|nr:integrase core domain-containing protein [Candidatus Berkelbacteria bacterium]